jgi:hypothetical protein
MNFQNKTLTFYGNKTQTLMDSLLEENFIDDIQKEPVNDGGEKIELVDIHKKLFLKNNINNSLCTNFLKKLIFFRFRISDCMNIEKKESN